MLQLAFLLIAASSAAQVSAPSAVLGPQPFAAPAEIATRIAIVGADLSDGFGLQLDVGARTSLAEIADLGLIGVHDPVLDQGATMLFVNPEATARQELAAATAKNATLLVAVDLLFWFGYGRGSDSSRLERFERGLALLERCTAPLVVGDLPDMSAALQGLSSTDQGPQLRADQVPAPETLKKLNDRLREWAALHPNVIVLPMSELLGKVRGKDEIRLRGNVWPKAVHEQLLQADKLHTTAGEPRRLDHGASRSVRELVRMEREGAARQGARRQEQGAQGRRGARQAPQGEGGPTAASAAADARGAREETPALSTGLR